MKYVISRSINGISLNGQEFLLNSNGDVTTFSSKAAAVFFANKICSSQHGDTVDLEEYGINICEMDGDGNYTLL